MKRVLKIIAVVGLITTGVAIIAHLTLKGGRSTSSAVPPQLVTPQLQTVHSSPPASRTTKPQQATAEMDNAKFAVLAAAQATSNLSQALFLPNQQMKQVVESAVVPSRRQVVEQGYLVAGRATARGLNYQSISDVRDQANFYVVTQRYWVQSFSKTKALIWLYNITHVVTAPDQAKVVEYAYTHPGSALTGSEYFVPSITIVQMQWFDGHWLWAGTRDPSADQIPPQKGHPTLQQAIQAYTPYVRRFRSYASLQK